MNPDSPIGDRRKEFDELMRLFDELGYYDGPLVCEEHDRAYPCRPCLRAEGFYE